MPLIPYPNIEKSKETNDWAQRVTSFGNEKEPLISVAQVSFNGSGSVAVNNSYGVTSVSDNGVGDYTINLEKTLLNTTSIVVTGSGSVSSGSTSAADAVVIMPSALTTSSVRVLAVRLSTGSVVDSVVNNVTIKGDL